MKLNQKGLTLVELLAVIVIMGIVGMVAVLAIGQIIDKSKHQAFVANAYTLKDAASLYAKESLLYDRELTKVTYETLYENNMIEEIKDPFTNNLLDPESNQSYVIIDREQVSSICFIGETKKICNQVDDDESPVLIEDLDTAAIQDN
ncbi:type II secretion system protein [Bacillus sp. AK031]